MAMQALIKALGVEMEEKSFRTGVVYRFFGQIDWKAVDRDVIKEYIGRDVRIEVAGKLYDVDLHGSKAIVPVRSA